MTDEKYLDPKQNPFIKVDDEFPQSPDEPGLPFEESPIDLPGPDGKWPEEKPGSTVSDSGPDDLEKNILNLMGDMSGGSYEVVVEDGGTTPLMSVIRTADGKLIIETPGGEKKDFNKLTQLERKLIEHDLKTRKEFWGGRRE